MSQQKPPDDPEVQSALDPTVEHLREDDPNVARDPVCGGLVDKRTAENFIPASVDGSVGPFYFNSPECKAIFEEDPAKYGANY